LCSDLFDRLRSIARSVKDELLKPKYRAAHPGVFDNELAGCDILLVGGETRVPAVRNLVRDVFRGNLHTDVNPDEVVALGAALQAGIIQKKGHVGDIVLVDTTALSLGTEVQGGVFSKLIEGNTPIPCTKTGEYLPVADYQPMVKVGIYQGESELVAKNVKLGEFEFLLQPPRPKHDALILITFHLDANDILHVSAVDKKTGAKQSVTIKDSQNLDRETVQRMRQEAQRSQHEDRARAQRSQQRQKWEALLQEVRARIISIPPRDPAAGYARKVGEYAQKLQAALNGLDDDAVEKAGRELQSSYDALLAMLPGRGATPPPAQPAAVAAPAAPVEGMVNCGHCNARVPAGFAFCGKCGMPLKKDTCGSCGAALVEGFKFCGKCGAKVT
jgi:molecular chaperone DnaK